MKINKNIYEGKLTNNIKFIFIKNKCSKSSTIMFSVKVGSRNELINNYGISHFIEHMLFKGTKRRQTSKNISNSLYNYGAEFNASTGYEVTKYYVKINSDNIIQAIDILSDMLINSSFNKNDIEKEKKVVISENKKYRSNPNSLLNSLISNLIFKKTTFEHDIGGLDKAINLLTREKVLKYLNKFYKTDNILITIVGNYKYDNNELKKILNKYFNLKKRDIKNKRKVYNNFINIQKDFQYINRHKDISQAYISIGFPAYNMNNKNNIVLKVIANILGGNMSSRLFIKLRENRGLVYNVMANYSDYSDVGIFEISCGTFGDEKSILMCIELILKELKELKKNKISKIELNKNINYINGNFIINLEDSLNIANFYSNNILFNKKKTSIKDEINKIKNVTTNHIYNTSNDIFKYNKCNIALVSKIKIQKNKIQKIIKKIEF